MPDDRQRQRKPKRLTSEELDAEMWALYEAELRKRPPPLSSPPTGSARDALWTTRIIAATIILATVFYIFGLLRGL